MLNDLQDNSDFVSIFTLIALKTRKYRQCVTNYRWAKNTQNEIRHKKEMHLTAACIDLNYGKTTC
jgi:hypothetical protein